MMRNRRDPLAEAMAMLAGMPPGGQPGPTQSMGQMRRPPMPGMGRERIQGMTEPTQRQTMGRSWTVPPAFAAGRPSPNVPFAAPPPFGGTRPGMSARPLTTTPTPQPTNSGWPNTARPRRRPNALY